MKEFISFLKENPAESIIILFVVVIASPVWIPVTMVALYVVGLAIVFFSPFIALGGLFYWLDSKEVL